MDEKSKIIDKAQKLVQKGYLDKAIAEYKKVLAKYPKDVAIRLRVGDLYVKIGKKDEAIKEYSEVAKHHTQKGFYLKAIAVYKQILKLDETLVVIHFNLSDLYAKQGLKADAIAALSLLVGFYEKKAKINETIDVLKKMTAVDPQNVGVHLKLAEYYHKNGFTNDALAEYGAAFGSLVKDGKLDKAEKLYRGLYADNRRNIGILEGLADVYRAKGENEQLVKYHRELAGLYKEKGDNEKSKEAYEKILKIFPQDNEALNALGRKPEFKEPPPKAAPPAALLDEKTSKGPLISWPEVKVELPKEPEIKPQEQPAPAEIKEWPTIDIEEVISSAEKEIPMEEAAEIIPDEYTSPVEEIAVLENSKGQERLLEKPAGKHGLEGLGLEGFMAEGGRIVQEMEASSEEGYVDLSSELGLEEALDFLTESWSPGEKGQETFAEFKHGMEKQLSGEDTETHYNLGIAYMEMELYDDAMREFKIALKDPVFEFDCYIRLGLSCMAKGNHQEAVSSFLKGLKVTGRTDEERKGLMYELALAYEVSESNQEALEIFKSVYEMDKDFREVCSKIKELTKKSKKEDKTDDIPSMDDMLEVELL